MARGSRLVSDVLTIMRQVISRRSTNSPESTDAKLLSYVNDFTSLKMSDDVRLFEQFGTLSFNIDETVTTGVYTFNDVGATNDFVSISNEALISLLATEDESLNWMPLSVYRDPGEFFSHWGINNDDVITTGMPSEVLFYGNELTFRTIPDDEYIVKMYGYKKCNNFEDVTDALPYDRWLRYVTYGASLDYVRDYNYSAEKIAQVKSTFSSERVQMMAHRHSELTMTRCRPSF